MGTGLRDRVAGLLAEGRRAEARAALEAYSPFEGPPGKAPSEAYGLLAFLAAAEGDAEGAHRALEEGLRRHPRNAALLCAWGTLCWEEGNRREALDAWSRATREAPDWTRLDYLVAMATLGEPVSAPAASARESEVRMAPLYLPDFPGAASWYSGSLAHAGAAWHVQLSPESAALPPILAPGVRVMLVMSDDHGLYLRRAGISSVEDASVGVAFLEPPYRIQRRRHVRILAHHIVSGTVRAPGRPATPLEAVNLSAGGLVCFAPDPLAAGTRVRLALTVDPEGGRVGKSPRLAKAAMMELQAEVVRCRPHDRKHALSMQFLASVREQDALARLVHIAQLNLRRMDRA